MVHGVCLGNNRLKRQKFPGGPVVRTLLSLLGAQVLSLIRKLRSCKSNGSRGWGVGEEEKQTCPEEGHGDERGRQHGGKE